MNTRNIRLAHIGFCLVLLSAAPARGEASDCEANFTQPDKASVLSLFTTESVSYKSHAKVLGLSKAIAFTRAYREIVSDGFAVTQSDREIGSITATASGNGGTNQIVLNFLIDTRPDGLELSVRITASAGGMGHPEKHVCAPILAAAGEAGS